MTDIIRCVGKWDGRVILKTRLFPYALDESGDVVHGVIEESGTLYCSQEVWDGLCKAVPEAPVRNAVMVTGPSWLLRVTL